jgi:predicted small metal-binding protein
MTKRLDCVIDGCHASIEAETEDEIMARAQEHAAEAHPDVELDEETVEMIRGNVRDV